MSSTKKIKIEKKSLPFEKENYLFLAAGLVVIFFGYVALSQKPWDGFIALTLSPILLVLGYCVLIPIGILWRKKN
ncbi:MAG: hypothetical protein O3A55_06270 [Bacteroidetes bacterium]|nr:hypothetical protein [Bacteroidota bacterium]